ncbi:hypothetical protein CWR43_27180 [Rhizobium sullae]|uniref:Uncharacterized protein n=1 Tax=Rhizobium sullae TaxID=50338 RepID=A0A2N0D2C8_RHISU|nr:hypothetical protein CWR43_27180 [Rhizobium sullae]
MEGYRIFAVTGVNADTKGPLGFAVERYDPTENQRYFVYGMKVFASVIPKPNEKTVVTTCDHRCRASSGTISRQSWTGAMSIFSIR